MGIYFNPNNINFKMTVSSKIYVDKTSMLSVLNGYIGESNSFI